LFSMYAPQSHAQSLFGEWSELRDDASGCLKDDAKCIQTYKETGCTNTDKQYQCAQAYYTKQQNTAAVQQPVPNNAQQENTELKLQIQSLQQKLEIQEQNIKALQTQPPKVANSSSSLKDILIFGLLILITLMIGILVFKGKMLKNRQ